MFMLSTLSGTLTASSVAARMWCGVQLAGRHAQLLLKSPESGHRIGPTACHMLNHRVYQGEKKQIKNYLTCEGILCSKSQHKCPPTETMRGKQHELWQESIHCSIQKEIFWIWDQTTVYPILKWGKEPTERSTENRARGANTAWRQGEEGTGQATHRI